MMTKKHFERIAEEIKDTEFDSMKEKISFISRLSEFFRQENDKFDKHRFTRACLSEDNFMSNAQMRRVANKI